MLAYLSCEHIPYPYPLEVLFLLLLYRQPVGYYYCQWL